jgi:trehalose-phosphatase
MQQTHTSLQLKSFFEQLNSWGSGALALDYDGTLAPFQTDRDAAVPYPGVAPLIRALLATGRTRVVLVSGRPAEDVRRLLGVEPTPEIWGSHGRQRLWPDGRSEMAELRPADRAAIEEATSWIDTRDLRDLAEFKPGSVALHWRGLPAEQTARLTAEAHSAFASIAERTGIELLEFDGGIELRPSEPNKGSAVRVLLSEIPLGTPLAYLGDDTTDEDAFLALRGTGALTVLVRPEWRETNAQVWLRPPRELLDFLEGWLERTGGAR